MAAGKNRYGKEGYNEAGSVIIEAILCLTVFVVAVFTILAFINMCRAQAMMSEAVDAVAKEMSQYAYLYHLTGLDSLENSLYEKTEGDREKLSNIVDSAEAIYEALQYNVGDGEGDLATRVGSVFDGISLSAGVGDIVSGSIASEDGTIFEGGALADGINSLVSNLGAVDDPMSFCKSLLTVAGLKGSSIAKSRLIAAPLAKLLIKKHFEAGGEDADTYLRSFRIDGMDALNFNMSTIFDPESPEDIHLVLYYQMDAIDFFNFDMGTITLQKEAVTRAWLGGDGTP